MNLWTDHGNTDKHAECDGEVQENCHERDGGNAADGAITDYKLGSFPMCPPSALPKE